VKNRGYPATSVWCQQGRNQADHLSGKPGNVREFDSCQRNVRDFTENQGIVREKLPKTVLL